MRKIFFLSLIVILNLGCKNHKALYVKDTLKAVSITQNTPSNTKSPGQYPNESPLSKLDKNNNAQPKQSLSNGSNLLLDKTASITMQNARQVFDKGRDSLNNALLSLILSTRFSKPINSNIDNALKNKSTIDSLTTSSSKSPQEKVEKDSLILEILIVVSVLLLAIGGGVTFRNRNR